MIPHSCPWMAAHIAGDEEEAEQLPAKVAYFRSALKRLEARGEERTRHQTVTLFEGQHRRHKVDMHDLHEVGRGLNIQCALLLRRKVSNQASLILFQAWRIHGCVCRSKRKGGSGGPRRTLLRLAAALSNRCGDLHAKHGVDVLAERRRCV